MLCFLFFFSLQWTQRACLSSTDILDIHGWMKIWDRKTFHVPRFLLQSDKQYQINNIHKKYLCLCSIQSAAISPGLAQMVYMASCLLGLRKVKMVYAAFPSNIVHFTLRCVLLAAYGNFVPEIGAVSVVWNSPAKLCFTDKWLRSLFHTIYCNYLSLSTHLITDFYTNF